MRQRWGENPQGRFPRGGIPGLTAFRGGRTNAEDWLQGRDAKPRVTHAVHPYIGEERTTCYSERSTDASSESGVSSKVYRRHPHQH